MFYEKYKPHIEAMLFVSGDPVPAARLAAALDIDEENVHLLAASLKEELRRQNRGLALQEIAGGYQLCTRPDLAPFLERLGEIKEDKLSPSALETLSIIAFKQPITRQEIEQIRGVKIDRILLRLLDRDLIRETGRKQALGRPILYGTTEEFLKSFGLKSLKELPALPELSEADLELLPETETAPDSLEPTEKTQ